VICEASAEAFDHFEKVMKELYWLERCEDRLKGKPDVSLQEALLDVYAALLDIFFKIHSMFIKARKNVKDEGKSNETIYTKRKAVLIHMLLRSISGELAPMQETFVARCKTLSAGLSADTNQTVHDNLETAKRTEELVKQKIADENAGKCSMEASFMSRRL
jgi:superfamily II RNA helicase